MDEKLDVCSECRRISSRFI